MISCATSFAEDGAVVKGAWKFATTILTASSSRECDELGVNTKLVASQHSHIAAQPHSRVVAQQHSRNACEGPLCAFSQSPRYERDFAESLHFPVHHRRPPRRHTTAAASPPCGSIDRWHSTTRSFFLVTISRCTTAAASPSCGSIHLRPLIGGTSSRAPSLFIATSSGPLLLLLSRQY
jgi:hypothetical protein